jgi:hypothetical protein
MQRALARGVVTVKFGGEVRFGKTSAGFDEQLAGNESRRIRRSLRVERPEQRQQEDSREPKKIACVGRNSGTPDRNQG